MCSHCGDGGCAYCEGWFLSKEEHETLNQPRVRPLTEKEKQQRLKNRFLPDYELLQLQRQGS